MCKGLRQENEAENKKATKTTRIKAEKYFCLEATV